MYLSLEGMLCFLWLFLFLFYTQCMYYLWSCFWGVHWFKRICSKRCYKRIYYPVYGSLSNINHGNILTGHTRFVMFVLRNEKKKCVSLSAPLWTRLCIRCNLCYISFLFLWYKHVYGCKKKKDFMGEIHLLIKKAKLQPNTNELSNILPDRSPERNVCITLKRCHFCHF